MKNGKASSIMMKRRRIFLADRYIVGTCPVCGNESAYGDQCEKCGTSLRPEQLIQSAQCPEQCRTGKAQDQTLVFPLNKYEEWLKEWIVDGKKDEWKAQRIWPMQKLAG